MRPNEEMVRALTDLLKIESVSDRTKATGEAPFGPGCRQALDQALALCESMGMRVKNCGNLCGYAEIGQGEELMGILAHLDVVPAGDGWQFPAFGGTVAENRLYGRGTVDDKGPAVACIFAMADLLEQAEPLKKRVRLIFGTSEEVGDWEDMAYYKETEELPAFGFTPDADFPAVYGEKGILHLVLHMPGNWSETLEIRGGSAANMVADSCRATVETLNGGTLNLETTGRSAHGSMPEKGDNAISHMMQSLLELDNAGEICCPAARFYMRHIGFDLHGAGMGCDFSDAQSGSLTLNAGLIETTDAGPVLTLDIRYPVSCTMEQVAERIRQRVEPAGVTMEIAEHKAPVYMDRNGELIGTLVEVYRQVTADPTEPETIGGGTYARAMENIVAFGPMRPGREATEHQPNEYMALEDLYDLRKIYRLAIARLCR